MESLQCLKIAQKVSFNIASESSYVFILSGQKFIKNAKKSVIGQVNFNRTNIGGKCQIETIKQRVCFVIKCILIK